MSFFSQALHVSAQVGNPDTPTNYQQVVDIMINLLALLLPVLIALGLLLFIWGIVMLMSAQGSEDSVKIGKARMFWGIIILFVMISFWGILHFFVADFFGSGAFVIPVLPV